MIPTVQYRKVLVLFIIIPNLAPRLWRWCSSGLGAGDRAQNILSDETRMHYESS